MIKYQYVKNYNEKGSENMTQKQNISSLENKMKIILPHGISLCSIKDDMAIERKILTQRIHDYWQKNSFMLYRRGKQISMKAYISRLAIKQQYKKDTDWISQMINKQITERERKKMSVSEPDNFYRSGRQHTK